jgi:hypothetical protein
MEIAREHGQHVFFDSDEEPDAPALEQVSFFSLIVSLS